MFGSYRAVFDRAGLAGLSSRMQMLMTGLYDLPGEFKCKYTPYMGTTCLHLRPLLQNADSTYSTWDCYTSDMSSTLVPLIPCHPHKYMDH